MFDFFEDHPLLIIAVIILFLIAFVIVFFDEKSKEKESDSVKPNPSSKQINVLQKEKKKKSFLSKTSKSKAIKASGVSQEEKDQKSKDEQSETKSSEIKAKSDETETEKQTDSEQAQEKPKLVFKKKNSGETSQKKLKRSKNSKSIEQVYKRVQGKKKNSESAEIIPSVTEEDLLEKNVFVKTSKNVYKLVKRDENSELQAFQDELEDALEEYQGGDPEMDDLKSQLLKQKHGHFDKSRRLSRCVDEDEFDDMFVSHIGDRYLNINTGRHLNIDDEFNERLFKRASQTLSNSNIKIKGNGDVNKKIEMSESERDNAQREELARLLLQEDDEQQEESFITGNSDDSEILTNLNARDLILGQMLMTRKRVKK